MEAHVGGFGSRTVKLARKALARAREIEGRDPRTGPFVPRRKPPGLPEYRSRSGGEIYQVV